MMMPSMVSDERILFTLNALKDILMVEGMLINSGSPSCYVPLRPTPL